ncbi:hypothetical protein Tsubulata_047048 [Turnera subulata]|uniref:Replication protein A 70 kDa DNA-binding subunit B/D first OB fold domain-containing protein n=1 Tax=Turnera subulata TaxID=218843 RepID=A0A9Q0G7C0_9ROSI|nr:hypothetical protein Tsubulata_047048 [Turnera subulata]
MLNELSPDKETWNIKVRVVRLWESLNYKMQDQVISLDLIICDEEGTMMHAVANKMQVERFRGKFRKGKAYRLSKFKVLMQANQYRPVTHVMKLQILAFTKVEGIQCGTDRIPLHMFQFVDSALISERCNTTTFLTGENILSSTNATKVYLIPGIPKRKQLLVSCPEATTKILPLIQSSSGASAEDQKFENRERVSDILVMETTEYVEDDDKDIRVTLKGKIKEVHNSAILFHSDTDS